MRAWTTREVSYLEAHAGEGVKALSVALERPEGAIRAQARRYGLSLRPRWLCPKCGRVTYHPLSMVTGWCCTCTKESRRSQLEEEVRELEEEGRRELEANRARQALYSRKCRALKRLESRKQDAPERRQSDKEQEG